MKTEKPPLKACRFAVMLLLAFFLFDVPTQGQTFNSVVQVENLNYIQLRQLPPRKTSPGLPDTLCTPTSIPLPEPLTLACLPISHLKLTSGFGYRMHPVYGNIRFHNGIDLFARHAPIFSVLAGLVRRSGYDRAIGNFITISHGRYESTYGHLALRLVKVGDWIPAGTPIGISGKSGCVTGEHLHFIVRFNGQTINPLPFLKDILSVHKNEKLLTLLTSKL